MKHLSIDGFAGGGGASCGLKMAGIDVTIAINHDADGNPYPIKEQVAKIGNSVSPPVA